MKRHIPLILLCTTLLSGCDAKGPTQEELAREKARVEQAERDRKEEEQARKQAEQAREQAEQAREKAEAGKSTWQTVAWVAGVGAVILLIVGTAIGSSAKVDAQKTKSDSNE
jgi:hypothetical protein